MIISGVRGRSCGAVAVSVLLAGCSNGATPGAGGSAGGQVTGRGTVPVVTTSAIPVPTLPGVATKMTTSGAEAFVDYWWEVYEYSFATMRTDLMREASTDECRFCTGTAEMIDELRQTSASTSEIRTEAGESVAVVYSDRAVATVTGSVDVTGTTVRDRSGDLMTSYPSTSGTSYIAGLRYVDDGWVVVAVVLGKQP